MMKKILPAGRRRIVLSMLAFCLLTGIAWVMLERQTMAGPETGRLEKMIVANGSAAMDIDLNKLNGTGSRAQTSTLRFGVVPDSFFKVLVFNGELRGPLPSTMDLIPQDSPALPAKLDASFHQLVLESSFSDEPYELVVRDGKTGFVFFNIEGHQFEYNPKEHLLDIQTGRLLISNEFAAELGRPSQAGSVVGTISITATMRSIETTELVNGEATSRVLPANGSPEVGTVPGPDVIVGNLFDLTMPSGSTNGTHVGLAVGTDSCNAGVVQLNWFQLPDNDHPVIPQNIYRMSGGPANDERFEQIGQSNVKHAFTALQQDICGFGCQSSGTGTRLGSGCSDPYSASLNGTANLGSRAWINPFTGVYPRGDTGTSPNLHTGHSHTGPLHRMLTAISDLSTTQNPGATYYAEAQYVTPHEYAWCQANPGQCNQYNNASYRQYSVTGTTTFSFSPVGNTVQRKGAIEAWPGATRVQIEPAPGVDGIGAIAYKVTTLQPGLYRYEYAIYNQNMDRAIQSFGLPLATGTTLANVAFHAPPQHPGWTFDGTTANTGYSSTPWAQTTGGGLTTWSAETFAQNPNANAVRWGTLYNIGFTSSRAPVPMNATIGFLKTGAPITVPVQGPALACFQNVGFTRQC